MNLKYFITGILFVTCIGIYSQSSISLDTINASSTKVDIRVGSDYFAKGAWILDPTQNPDVFSIGSKWKYETLGVSFITDLDSFSINARPNSNYTFTVLLNQETPCLIQISTAPHPVFFDWKIVVFLSLLFITVGLFCFRFVSPKNLSRLLFFGYITPILFWFKTIIASNLQEEYFHLKNVISELGTLGSNAELFTSISQSITALTSFVFAIGFLRSSRLLKISKIPAYSTFILPASMIWASFFPLGNEFHSLFGAIPLIFILGVFLSIILWTKENFIVIRKISYLSLFLLLLIGLRFVPSIGHEYEGLIQRFFYLGWSIWLFGITFGFNRLLKDHREA